MLIATVRIMGRSPVLFSRRLYEERRDNETHDDLERRTAHLKAHTNADGNVCLPGVWFKRALDATAATVAEKIKGKGQQTYGKPFRVGVQVDGAGIETNIKATDLPLEPIECSSNGRSGSGSQVRRYFPRLDQWEGTLTFFVVHPSITKDKFVEYLNLASVLNGIGAFRPGTNGGMNGRFEVLGVEWEEVV